MGVISICTEAQCLLKSARCIHLATVQHPSGVFFSTCIQIRAFLQRLTLECQICSQVVAMMSHLLALQANKSN